MLTVALGSAAAAALSLTIVSAAAAYGDIFAGTQDCPHAVEAAMAKEAQAARKQRDADWALERADAAWREADAACY